MNIIKLKAILWMVLCTVTSSYADQKGEVLGHLVTNSYENPLGDVDSTHNKRRLSAWWNLFTLVHGPCLPGKPGEKCREDHDKKAAAHAAAAAAAAASSSASTTSASSVYGSDSSSSISTYSNIGGGSDGNSGLSGSTAVIGKFINSPAGTATIISLIALAASVAVAAVLVLTRRNHDSGNRHALHGMIKRRIGMFQALASRTKCATCRPEKVSDVIDDSTDYRLA